MMEKNAETEKELENNIDATGDVPPVTNDETEINEDLHVKMDDPTSKLKDDLAEAKDKYIRLYAEFENHRKRTAKEKLDLILSANEDLIRMLLPIVDDFERAEKAINESDAKNIEGYKLIHQKLKRLLEQYGVKQMDVNESEFNPDLHEAITQIEVEDEKKGKIVETMEAGYMLRDKVIRFAKVVVGK
ncbi:MAG: nucleotide exchange factor GrpE [Flammeovirgaceae bacterium]|nr:nucleotide exchange factor GrpE [Flammeovirgaceae bacterium]